LPRSAYADRSCIALRTLVGKNNFCDEQTHVRPRAAGVSPAWFYEPHLQVQCDEYRRSDLACGVHSTGDLRPPLLVGNASAGRIMRIPAASSTRTSLRPGTRPAHMRIYLRTRYVHHGGLTPPLLVAQCRFAGENGSRSTHRISLRKTTFALHKRKFTRAAGVSPPWLVISPVGGGFIE
jgi:hypothetical protein